MSHIMFLLSLLAVRVTHAEEECRSNECPVQVNTLLQSSHQGIHTMGLVQPQANYYQFGSSSQFCRSRVIHDDILGVQACAARCNDGLNVGFYTFQSTQKCRCCGPSTAWQFCGGGNCKPYLYQVCPDHCQSCHWSSGKERCNDDGCDPGYGITTSGKCKATRFGPIYRIRDHMRQYYCIIDEEGPWPTFAEHGYFKVCGHRNPGRYFKDDNGSILVIPSNWYVGDTSRPKYLYASYDDGYVMGDGDSERPNWEWDSPGPMYYSHGRQRFKVDTYGDYFYASGRWYTNRDYVFTKVYDDDESHGSRVGRSD